MKEISLRDFYPWYSEDTMIKVTEEVLEELLADQRYIKSSRRRRCDRVGRYCRYRAWTRRHEKIFGECSLSIFFSIIKLTRLIREISPPPTTE